MGKYTSLMPAFFAVSTMLIIPLIFRNSPLRESSPTKRRFLTLFMRSCFEMTRIESAIGKSRQEPSFARSAGARLTVTF